MSLLVAGPIFTATVWCFLWFVEIIMKIEYTLIIAIPSLLKKIYIKASCKVFKEIWPRWNHSFNIK